MELPSGITSPREGVARRAGFSLIETLVALAILGIAVLFTMTLIAREPLIERRLEAHAEALEVLDALHEAVRAGMSLERGTERLDWQRLYDPPRALRAAQDLAVWSEVEPLTPPGLYRLTLRARYFVGPKSFDRVLETMVWRP